MRIRITGAKKNTYWYAGKIGEVFEVTGGSTDYSGGVLVLHDGSRDRFVVQLGDYETITEDSAPITALPDESLGGIKREYREVKRQAEVGERIKNLRARTDYPAGTVSEVLRLDFDEGVVTKDLAGHTRYSNEKSYVVLEPTDVVYVDDADGVSRKYRMVDRKAEVGERVIALRDCGIFYKRGNVGAVRGVSNDGSVRVYFSGKGCDVGDGIYYLGNDIGYRVLEPIGNEEVAAPQPLSTRPSAEQAAENIASLTAKVQTLESCVHSLEARVKALEVGEELLQELPQKVADGLAELFEGPPPKSAQQIRDEIVERAKADVKALSDRDGYVKIPNSFGSNFVCVTEFIVNRNKRKVTVVLRGYTSRKVRAVGWAKCAPNDVFNAHIGKAIALRRALGLEIPAEYLTAPNPTEIRVGDVVTFEVVREYGTEYEVTTLNKHGWNLRIVRDEDGDMVGKPADGGDLNAGVAIIIDDSREGENPSSAKGAAA